MDVNALPPTAYIAAGTLLASLIAAIFSYLNMIASKENKVSEFRLVWIDGLRNEVAEFCSAVQNLGFVAYHYDIYQSSFNAGSNTDHLKWLSEISSHRSIALNSITKIRLRLNHQALETDSPEKKLITAIDKARERLNEDDFQSLSKSMDDIRAAAAPILKSSWETVKKGEKGYIKVRRSVEVALVIILAFIFIGSIYQYKNVNNENKKQKEKMEIMMKSVKALRDNLDQDYKNETKNQNK